MDSNNLIIGPPEKKNQHYIPQFFLRGFTGEDGMASRIWRVNGSRLTDCRRKSTKEICSSSCRYETMLSNGEALFPNGIEDAFSAIENELSAAFAHCKDRIKEYHLNPPSSEELQATVYLFSLMLSWFVYRKVDPADVVFLDEIESFIREHEALTGQNLLSAFLAEVGVSDGGLPIDVITSSDKARSMAMYLTQMPTAQFPKAPVLATAFWLSACSIVALKAPTRGFVGADFPFIESGAIPLLYWPIADDLALLYINDARHMFATRVATEEDVYRLNEAVSKGDKWDFLFGSDDDVMHLLLNDLLQEQLKGPTPCR